MTGQGGSALIGAKSGCRAEARGQAGREWNPGRAPKRAAKHPSTKRSIHMTSLLGTAMLAQMFSMWQWIGIIVLIVLIIVYFQLRKRGQ